MILESPVIGYRNYVNALEKVYGDDWRSATTSDKDGCLGVLIVRALLDGTIPRLDVLSRRLGIESGTLQSPFMRLSLNGVFNRVYFDESLTNGDKHAWCYYAGIASGATGNVQIFRKEK